MCRCSVYIAAESGFEERGFSPPEDRGANSGVLVARSRVAKDWKKG